MNVWLAALLILSACSDEATSQAPQPPAPSPPQIQDRQIERAPPAKPDRPISANPEAQQKKLHSITNHLEYMQRYIGLPEDEH